MPHRKNAKADVGSAKRYSDTHDMDNIYLSEEGWVYRHFKNSEKTLWWDEILVAGQVKPGMSIGGQTNDPVVETNPSKLGTEATDDITFQTGDSEYDYRYSDHQGAPEKVVVGDKTDFEQTSWEAINVLAADEDDVSSQIPTGWTGVSSPEDILEEEPPYPGEDYVSENEYTIEPLDKSVPPPVVKGTFESDAP